MINHEHFPKAEESEVLPAVSLESVAGEVRILGTVVPIEQRTFEAECDSCKTRLSFHVRHVFKTYITWMAWISGRHDGYEIKCALCGHNVNVKRFIPEWVTRKI